MSIKPVIMKVVALVVLFSMISAIAGDLYWEGGFSDGSFPFNALSIGWTQGDALFVCRAHHRNNLIPGKLHPRTKRCFLSYNGDEHIKEDYDVLTGKGKWVISRNGNVPDRAYVGGYEGSENLYVCRAQVEGTFQPGKFKPSHKTCYVPYGFKEHGQANFDVLVSS